MAVAGLVMGALAWSSVVPSQAQQASSSSRPPGSIAARVTLVDPCPSFPGQLTNEQWEQMANNQTELLPTLAAVQTYIKPQLGPSTGTRVAEQDAANPSSEFGTVGMAGPWDRQVVFLEVTGLTENRQRHADALTAIVPRPDRLVICPTAISEGRRAQIQNEVAAEFILGKRSPLFYGVRVLREDGGRVAISLRSDAVELAKRLQQRYGDDIRLTLGHFSWPDINASAPGQQKAHPKCQIITATTGPKLQFTLPKKLRVKSGETLTVPFSVRNASAAQIQLSPFEMFVTRRGEAQVVASHGAEISYVAMIDYLGPKTTVKREVTLATDSCVASTGWALPPGEYSVHVVTPPGWVGPQYRSPPIPLTVTKR